MDYFVRSGGLTGFSELVRELGYSPGALLRQMGLGAAVLQNPDLYIPYSTLAELLSLAARECHCPDFGVRLGGRQGLHVVGALGSLMCLQSTLPDALTMMQRNLDFHARGVRVDVDTQGDTLETRLSFAFENQLDCSQLTALSLALLFRSISQLHQSPLRLTDVHLRIPRPASPEHYQDIFKAPIFFDVAENNLRYPIALLNTPVDPSPALRQALSNQWRGTVPSSRSDSLPQHIEQVVTALLPTGECNLNMVAKVTEMNPRSLQLRLQAMGSGFTQIQQRVRLRLACHYLKNSDIDLTALALNLGFAELSVFSRAFKKWTGKSPRQWRNQARRAS